MPADSDLPVISLVDCSAGFGGFLALRNISLAVRKGEAVALLGPSGCGKTTLLRVISGAVPATGQRDVRGRAGVVYQDLKLLPWITVMENVLLAGSKSAGLAVNRENAISLLNMAAIGTKADSYPYQLSGGQRQRVAIARALFGGADTILLDEPFSALDFVARQRLLDVLRSIKASGSITLVIVTHDLKDAIDLADRLLVLKDGHIVGEFDTTSAGGQSTQYITERVSSLYVQ